MTTCPSFLWGFVSQAFSTDAEVVNKVAYQRAKCVTIPTSFKLPLFSLRGLVKVEVCKFFSFSSEP